MSARQESPHVTKEKLGEALPEATYSVAQISVVLFFDVIASDSIKEGLATVGSDMQSIKNACMESSLAHLRKLNQFFRLENAVPNPHKDDPRAYQFPGFDTPGEFLIPADASRINKSLMHFTHVTNDNYWHFRHYFEKAIPPVISFLKYLQRSFLDVNNPLLLEMRRIRSDCERFSRDILER